MCRLLALLINITTGWKYYYKHSSLFQNVNDDEFFFLNNGFFITDGDKNKLERFNTLSENDPYITFKH